MRVEFAHNLRQSYTREIIFFVTSSMTVTLRVASAIEKHRVYPVPGSEATVKERPHGRRVRTDADKVVFCDKYRDIFPEGMRMVEKMYEIRSPSM